MLRLLLNLLPKTIRREREDPLFRLIMRIEGALSASAPDRNRTYDTFFRREVLYPLSYWGKQNESSEPTTVARKWGTAGGDAPFEP